VFSAMLLRCPLYLSHGPAAEICTAQEYLRRARHKASRRTSSVVHFPLTRKRHRTSLNSKGSPLSICRCVQCGLNGSSFSSLEEEGSIAISTDGSGCAVSTGRKAGSPWEKPRVGSSSATGGSKRKGLPSEPISSSVIGLKERRPAKAMAVTMSGEVRKFIVLMLPSFRPLKLRLKEVRMAVQRQLAQSSDKESG
jgi:hypothetical protein